MVGLNRSHGKLLLKQDWNDRMSWLKGLTRYEFIIGSCWIWTESQYIHRENSRNSRTKPAKQGVTQMCMTCKKKYSTYADLLVIFSALVERPIQRLVLIINGTILNKKSRFILFYFSGVCVVVVRRTFFSWRKSKRNTLALFTNTWRVSTNEHTIWIECSLSR